MKLTDILIILATSLGPVLAVQAQKFVEIIRERRQRKLWVFHTLMTTRAARLGADHVQALNMIDLTFYGHSFFGINRRSRREQTVINSWREYLDHLETSFDDEQAVNWRSRGKELFVNLLNYIAVDVEFTFDRVQLKKHIYSPVAHGRLEEEQEKLRQLAIAALSGKSPLSINVSSMPSIDFEALRAQIGLHKSLRAALTDYGPFNVSVKGNSPIQ
ncbi:DUF6680 family protein [Xanthomonas campestris]|uniref:DUF6680 family protein n=1 Tax=Xanthomonas campestris TaxID=339 RepID=UPI003CF2DDA5